MKMNTLINKKYYLYVFVMSFLLSCSSNEVNTTGLMIIGYDEPILSNGEQLEFESLEIIPLEQTEYSMIDMILRVDVVDSMFIVQTGSKLLGFNRNGDFICEYGQRGRGPKEYLNFSSFVINRNNKQVHIIDENMDRILIFNIIGSFESSKNYERKALYMLSTTGEYLNTEDILFSNRIYNDMNIIFSIFNNELGTKRDILKFPVKTKNVATPTGRRTISLYQDTAKLIVPFDSNIYTIDDNYQLKSLISILTKQSIIPNKMIEQIDDFGIDRYVELMGKDYFVGFTDIFETQGYILLNFFNLNYFLIDKTSQSGRLYSYGIRDNHCCLPLIDIIGSTAEYLIGIGDPMKLIGLNEKFTDSENAYLNKLKHYSETLSLNSNPSLLMYKIK